MVPETGGSEPYESEEPSAEFHFCNAHLRSRFTKSTQRVTAASAPVWSSVAFSGRFLPLAPLPLNTVALSLALWPLVPP
eukprot:3668638-Amphidinium_carterae.1